MPTDCYYGDSLDYFFKNMMSFGDFFRFGVFSYHWNKLFRRDAILPFQLAVDDGFTVMEDGATVYPALLAAKKIVLTDNFAYHYRQREDSMLKSASSLRDEAQRLKPVNEFLLNAIEGRPEAYGLKKQVNDLMLAVYIIRCGGITEINNDAALTSIYGKNLEGKRVVIGGAGTFGQQMYRRLADTGKVDIVGWIDPYYWEYRRIGMNVDPVATIADLDFDYVLMAGLDNSFKTRVTSTLSNYGVAPAKVLSVDMDYDTRLAILQEYLRN